MHYELWGNSSGNFIAAAATESEAYRLVRELLAAGWKADDISLGLEPDNESEAEDLPPVIEGPELARQAYEAAGEDQARVASQVTKTF